MTRPLRIAMVTNYPVDLARIHGGVQAVAVRLVEALQEMADLELHVVHCHSDIERSQVVCKGAVTLHFIAQTRYRVIPNMTTAIGAIARRLQEICPDVVHAQDSPSFALGALRAGHRPIWTLHSVTAEEAKHYDGAFHRLSHALTGYYERRAFRRVNDITAVSAYLLDAYRAPLGQRGHRKGGTLQESTLNVTGGDRSWHVIENPAPPDYFQLEHRPVPGRVLMPATLIPLKDSLTLIRAAAEARQAIPGLSIQLAGATPDPNYLAEVQAEIVRLHLQATVAILGPLDRARLREAFSTAAVVALSSRQDVSPMAVIEAMAAGVPVLASAVGGLPYLVDNGTTGLLVPPGAVGEWAAALESLLPCEETLSEMGRAARECARARFDPARVAAAYAALYREVARREGQESALHVKVPADG